MQQEVFVLNSVETHEDIPNATHEIYRAYRAGTRVIAVVSASGETTEHLARSLDRSGIPARIVDPREVGLTVTGSARDSQSMAVDAERLRSLLSACPVLVIPGFYGIPADGRTHLLGRGGADLSADSRLAHSPACPPLRVLLLGMGTVGFGIYQRLIANPGYFCVEAALVRNPAKYEALGVRGEMLVVATEKLRALRPDVVIDACPGIEPSRELAEYFLSKGADFISANKALIADHGDCLTRVAAQAGGTLRFSASVGGSTPMLEAVTRAAASGPLASIAAVLNGTCNYLLDTCGAGATLEAALAEARLRGFAEDDPADDLTGRDAERKLAILARLGFGAKPRMIEVQALGETIASKARETARAGFRLRQISRLWMTSDQLHGSVIYERVEANSEFGCLAQERNALKVELSNGHSTFVSGRGAGRWPTTEAVMADLFDVLRSRWTLDSDQGSGSPAALSARPLNALVDAVRWHPAGNWTKIE